MSIRFLAAAFGALALGLGGCSVLPTQAAPPPVTITVPAPPPAPAPPPPASAQQQDSASESGEAVEKYEHCRWGDDVIGWMCQLNGAGNGYTDVADDDPRIGLCAGLNWDECYAKQQPSESEQPEGNQPSTGESESSTPSESESGTTSNCSSPEVYDPYQCPGDSPHEDGNVDSGEVEQSCQFHRGPEATEQELQECQANY